MGFSLLIHDLGFVIVVSFVVSVLFDKLKLPSIFGFLLAGILLGPHTFPEFSPISGRDSVQQLSELGILFLMFSIGMEFHIERVRKILFPCFVAVVFQTVFLSFVGLQVAKMLGWDSLQGIFLAAMMALSSTMVAIAVLKDSRMDRALSGNLAIGILVFEDILAILLLVLLSGMENSEEGANLSKVLRISGLIAIFIVCAYYFGRLLITRIIDWIPKDKVKNYVTIFAFAHLMAFSLLAESLHFSGALGAFLAGSILVQSKLFDEIEKATQPLRDIFIAIFFVSIGMLIEPSRMGEHFWVILFLGATKILGTLISCSSGLLLSGINPRDSVNTAIVKSQLGEFAFVIAALGISMDIFEGDIINIITGAAMLSMILTPLLFRARNKIYSYINRGTPQYSKTILKVHKRVVEQFIFAFQSKRLQLRFSSILKIVCYCFLFFGFVLIASILSKKSAQIVLFERVEIHWFYSIVWSFCFIMVLFPVRGIIRNSLDLIKSPIIFKNDKQKPYIENLIKIVLTTSISIISGLIYLGVASAFVPTFLVILFSVVFIGILFLFFRHQILHFDSKIEKAFLSSFYECADELVKKERKKRLNEIERKTQSSAVIREFEVPSNTKHGAKSIAELNIRKFFGVTVLGTIRGGSIRFNPDPNSYIFPKDHLIVTGKSRNIKECLEYLKTPKEENDKELEAPLTLQLHRILIVKEHPFLNQSLVHLDLRKKKQISILYMIRGNDTIEHMDPDMLLCENDAVYAIGNPQEILFFGGILVE